MLDLKIIKIFLYVSKKRAAQVIILLSCLALFYHVLIVSGVVPYKYAWGGKIESQEQLWVFELISTVINFGIIYLAASGAKMIKSIFPKKLLTVLLWLFSGLLFINTIGNLLAEECIEMIIFTPITAIMSILFARIAVQNR